MPIIEVQERYRELGRLRMGDLDGRRPVKLETWRMTSPSRALLEAAADRWGGQVNTWEGAPTEGEQYELTTDVQALPVLVPPQDIDNAQFFELWAAGGCKRRCDGATEFLSGRACICAKKDERECKPTTQLLVMLPDIPDVGVWRVRTLGWNAAAEIPQTVKLLGQMVGKGVFPEATLAIEQRTSKTDGQTHHYVVPVLQLPFSLTQLMNTSPTAHAMTTGQRELVPLPGDRPALPSDPSFADETDPAWGARAPLPPQSEAVVGDDAVDVVPATRDQVVKLHAIAGQRGWDDDEKHSRAGVDSLNHLSKDRASALIEEWTTLDDPPETSTSAPGDDEPAPPQQWARAQELKLSKTRVLRMARELFPDDPPKTASDLTQGQLARVIEEALSR